VLVSPHEELRAVPLHALPIGGDAVLIDRWPVQYVPTFALFSLRRRDAIPDRVLALGCVEGAFGGPPLPELRGEVASIRAAWEEARPGHVMSAIIPDDGASPAAVGAPLERWSDYGILHLACHGDFPTDRPFDASLMLGDQQVGGSDLFATRLRASLVALSACSLGRSDDDDAVPDPVVDEWTGLLLPLSYAGAESVLMSLWAADSATTLRVMTELHRALRAGAAPAVALQRAITTVRAMPPSLWANWRLTGLPQATGSEVSR
jgi:CHAT domain-containing protein